MEENFFIFSIARPSSGIKMDPVSITEPAAKKQKTVNSIAMTIEQYIEDVKGRKHNLIAVLQDDVFEPISLTKVYIGHIRDVKDISKAIAVLNEKIPLKELAHLKRVRKRDIVLCPVRFLDSVSSIQEYIECHVEELKNMFEYFKEIDVPLSQPLLTSHFRDCSKLWSCNFHPNKYLERLVDGSLFTSTENDNHTKFMVLAFEVAKWYLGDSDCNMSCLNAAVVVDPSTNSVVATAFDNRMEHPVKHAAMLAIDNVAKTQNGGAWGDESKTAVALRGVDENLMGFLKKKFFPSVAFGAKQSTDDKGPYLCTGYYVYLIKEPCVMCAMALVHARVKRVFFCLDNKELGALKSRVKLQTVSSLNHHFEVFTGFIETSDSYNYYSCRQTS